LFSPSSGILCFLSLSLGVNGIFMLELASKREEEEEAAAASIGTSFIFLRRFLIYASVGGVGAKKN
jgi:hypothetical protein